MEQTQRKTDSWFLADKAFSAVSKMSLLSALDRYNREPFLFPGNVTEMLSLSHMTSVFTEPERQMHGDHI